MNEAIACVDNADRAAGKEREPPGELLPICSACCSVSAPDEMADAEYADASEGVDCIGQRAACAGDGPGEGERGRTITVLMVVMGLLGWQKTSGCLDTI